MPWIPTSWRASFASSSLNGFMIASIFFMHVPPPRPQRPRAVNALAVFVPKPLRALVVYFQWLVRARKIRPAAAAHFLGEMPTLRPTNTSSLEGRPVAHSAVAMIGHQVLRPMLHVGHMDRAPQHAFIGDAVIRLGRVGEAVVLGVVDPVVAVDTRKRAPAGTCLFFAEIHDRAAFS